MSAPLAGKFQDHYEVLGLSPRATLAEIQQVCQQLSEKYDPVMGTEPDLDKFEGVKLALEVLSDPELRAQFDKLKGIEEKPPQFTGLPFFEGLGEDARLRTALLCVLFDRRRSNPVKPTLNMRQIERIINADSESFILATWYLKQRGMITVNDKSHLEITVKGIDELEGNPPDPEMVLGMIRPEGLAGYEPPEPEHEEVPVETSTAETEEGATSDAVAEDVPVEEAMAGLQALAGAVSKGAGASPEPADSEPDSRRGPEPALEPVASAAAMRVRVSTGQNPVDAPAAGPKSAGPKMDAAAEVSGDPSGEDGTSESWSVSTPLGDSSGQESRIGDPTQTLGGRLKGILGRPRYR